MTHWEKIFNSLFFSRRVQSKIPRVSCTSNDKISHPKISVKESIISRDYIIPGPRYHILQRTIMETRLDKKIRNGLISSGFVQSRVTVRTNLVHGWTVFFYLFSSTFREFRLISRGCFITVAKTDARNGSSCTRTPGKKTGRNDWILCRWSEAVSHLQRALSPVHFLRHGTAIRFNLSRVALCPGKSVSRIDLETVRLENCFFTFQRERTRGPSVPAKNSLYVRP